MVSEKKNILFICKYNRFRSKVAEAIFKKYNKNSNFKARSAGIKKATIKNPFQRAICKSVGIKIDSPPKILNKKLIEWSDMIILVSDEVSPTIFEDYKKNGKKVIVWRIADAKVNDKRDIIKTVKKIRKKVTEFIKNLE